MSKLDDLRATVEAMTDAPPWRQGSVEKYNLFVHDIDSLGGTAGERVLLRANTHYPYVGNLAGIVALRNAAPALLAVVDAVDAFLTANDATLAGDRYYIPRAHAVEKLRAARKRLEDLP